MPYSLTTQLVNLKWKPLMLDQENAQKRILEIGAMIFKDIMK